MRSQGKRTAKLLALLAACVLALAAVPPGSADDDAPAKPAAKPADPQEADKPAAAQGEEAVEEEPTDNPYLAPEGLAASDLVRYITRLQARPKTIRRRPMFIDAVVDAAERALEGQPSDEQRAFAALTLMEVLHEDAVLGNDKADEKLMTWAEKLHNEPHEKIARAAQLHLTEKRVMEARQAELSPEELQKLVAEMKDYLSKETLTRQHLRLASDVVGLINTLEDVKLRNELFDELGQLMAKSDDPDLSRYGRRILKKPGTGSAQPSALVGKPLDLDGMTVDGVPFNWKDYRGKIVLVDFWATWCGPCRAELPNVKAAYEKFNGQGFDVVGISLDNDKDDLLEFIAEQQLPWANLFDEEAKGWDNPLAKKYSIQAIPATFLVDKNGTVIAANLRGPALETAIEQALAGKLPAAEKQEKKDEGQKKDDESDDKIPAKEKE